MNRYLYAHANPWTFVDPDGHSYCNANSDLCDETMAIQHPSTSAGKKAATRQKHKDAAYHRPGSAANTKAYVARARASFTVSKVIRRMADAHADDARETRSALGRADPKLVETFGKAWDSLSYFKSNYDEQRGWTTLPDLSSEVPDEALSRLGDIGDALTELDLQGEFGTADRLFQAQQKYVPVGYSVAAQAAGQSGGGSIIAFAATVAGGGSEGLGGGHRPEAAVRSRPPKQGVKQ
jgi:hypothetical protein